MNIKDILAKVRKKKYSFSKQGKQDIIKGNEMINDETEYYVMQGLHLDAIKEYPTNYEGILEKIISDQRLSMLVVSVQGGTRSIAQHCNLSNDQCKIVCSLALLTLFPEIDQKLYIGDDFCSQLDLKWGSNIEVNALQKCHKILYGLAEKMREKIKFVRAPKEFSLQVALYDDEKNSAIERYIILQDKTQPPLIAKAILAGLHGFNYEQIEYFNNKNLFDHEILFHRKDIWKQFLQASVCLALGKWPKLNAWGWE